MKPPKINKIFIDLDDVLNKMTMYFLHVIGTKVTKDLSEDFYDPGWAYDIIKAANCLSTVPGVRFSSSAFWDSISKEHWATVPFSDEFSTIITQASRIVGKSGVAILSRPTDDPECCAGKHQWIRSHCPQWLRNKFLIGSPKYMCASPESLLIDDSDKQVREFMNPPGKLPGGQAILVPRPWNSLYEYDTSNYLEVAFSRIRSGMGMRNDPKVIAVGLDRKE